MHRELPCICVASLPPFCSDSNCGLTHCPTLSESDNQTVPQLLPLLFQTAFVVNTERERHFKRTSKERHCIELKQSFKMDASAEKIGPDILTQHYCLSLDLRKVLEIVAFHQEELTLAQSPCTSSSYIAAANVSSGTEASATTDANPPSSSQFFTATAVAQSSDGLVDVSKATFLKLEHEDGVASEPFSMILFTTESELETALEGLNSPSFTARLKAFDALKSATKPARLHSFWPTLLRPKMDQIIAAMALQIKNFSTSFSNSDLNELSSEKAKENEKESVNLLRSIDSALGNLLRWSTVVVSSGQGGTGPPPLTVQHFGQLFRALLGGDNDDDDDDHLPSSFNDCSPEVATQLQLITATLLTTADCEPTALLLALLALLQETFQGLDKSSKKNSETLLDLPLSSSSSISLYRRLDQLAEWLETAGEHLTEWRLASMASNFAYDGGDSLNGLIAVLVEIDRCLRIFPDSALQTNRDFRLLEALRQLLEKLTLFADATQSSNDDFFELVLYSSSDTVHASSALCSLSLRYIQQTMERTRSGPRCDFQYHHQLQQQLHQSNSPASDLVASFHLDSSNHSKLRERRLAEIACFQPLKRPTFISLMADNFSNSLLASDGDHDDKEEKNDVEKKKMGLNKAFTLLGSPDTENDQLAAAFEYFIENAENVKGAQQYSAKQVETLLQCATLQLKVMVIRLHKDFTSMKCPSTKVLASAAEEPVFHGALRLVRALLPLPSLNEVSPQTLYDLATLLFTFRATVFGFAVNEAATETAEALFNEENGLEKTKRLGVIMKMMTALKATSMENSTMWDSYSDYYRYDEPAFEVVLAKDHTFQRWGIRMLPPIVRTHLERVTRGCFWSMLQPLMLEVGAAQEEDIAKDSSKFRKEKEEKEKKEKKEVESKKIEKQQQRQIDQLNVPLLFSLIEQCMVKAFSENDIKQGFEDFFAQQRQQRQNQNFVSFSSLSLRYNSIEPQTQRSFHLLSHLLYLLIVERVQQDWPLSAARAGNLAGKFGSLVYKFQQATYNVQFPLSNNIGAIHFVTPKVVQQKRLSMEELFNIPFGNLASLQELFTRLKKCLNDLEKCEKRLKEAKINKQMPGQIRPLSSAWVYPEHLNEQQELFFQQLTDLTTALFTMRRSKMLVKSLKTEEGETPLALYIAVLTEVVLFLSKIKEYVSHMEKKEEETLLRAVEFVDRLLSKLLTISPPSFSSVAVMNILGTYGDVAHLTDLLLALLDLRLKGLQGVQAPNTDCKVFCYCLHSEKLATFTRLILEQCGPSMALHVLCRLLRLYMQSELFRDQFKHGRHLQLSYLYLLQETVEVVLAMLFTHPTARMSEEEEETRQSLTEMKLKLPVPTADVPSLFVDEPSLAHFLAVVEQLMSNYKDSFMEQEGNYRLLETVKRTIDLLVDRHGHHLAAALNHWSSTKFLDQVMEENGSKENDDLLPKEATENGRESRGLLKSYIEQRLLLSAQSTKRSPAPIHFAVPWSRAPLSGNRHNKQAMNSNANENVIKEDDKEDDFNYDEDEEGDDGPLYEEEEDDEDDDFELV